MENKQKLINNIKDTWAKKNGKPIKKSSTDLKNIEIIKQIADFFSAGLYYYFILNFETQKVEFVSDSVKDFYGFDLEGLTLEKMLKTYEEEDLKLMNIKEEIAFKFLFEKIDLKDIPEYKVSYMVKTRTISGQKKTILHQSKAFEMTEDGKLKRILGIHTDLSHLNIRVDNKVSFISNSKQSYFAYDISEFIPFKTEYNFSAREITIIEYLAKGLTEQEIAEKLFISPLTVKTHKKNIFEKSEVKNSAELVAICIRENII